jgi:hypothetical protein
MQTSSILNQAIAIGLDISWLHHFKTHLPSPWPTYCNWLVFDMDKYNQLITGGQFLTWKYFNI